MYSFHNLFVSAITVISFTTNAWHSKAACDVARKWQLTLQDPATPIMEGIINFHSTIMFFLIVIGVFVGWLLFRCLFFYNESKNSSQNIDNFTHSTGLEIVWTLVPAFILLIISFPSFALLYSMDDYDSENPAYTIRVVGHQWYWSYEHDCSVNLGKWTRIAEPKPHDLVTLQFNQNFVEKFREEISLVPEILRAYKKIKVVSLLTKFGILSKDVCLQLALHEARKISYILEQLEISSARRKIKAVSLLTKEGKLSKKKALRALFIEFSKIKQISNDRNTPIENVLKNSYRSAKFCESRRLIKEIFNLKKEGKISEREAFNLSLVEVIKISYFLKKTVKNLEISKACRKIQLFSLLKKEGKLSKEKTLAGLLIECNKIRQILNDGKTPIKNVLKSEHGLELETILRASNFNRYVVAVEGSRKLSKEKALTTMIGKFNKKKQVIVNQIARAVELEKTNKAYRDGVKKDLFFLDILKFRTALPFLVKSKVPVFNDNLGKNNQNIAVVPPKFDLPWTFMICTKVVRNLERPQGAFDSYMIDESDLLPGQYRLLEVDNRLYVPINTDTRVLITSADVLHSWAVPSLGIKIDACPGRMNEATLRINRIGTFYGQCSEICGVNHGFMPIVVNGCSLDKFLAWRKGLADNS